MQRQLLSLINLDNIFVNENNRLELGEIAFTYEKDESTEKNSKQSDVLSLVYLISFLARLIKNKAMYDEFIKLKNEDSSKKNKFSTIRIVL